MVSRSRCNGRAAQAPSLHRVWRGFNTLDPSERYVGTLLLKPRASGADPPSDSTTTRVRLACEARWRATEPDEQYIGRAAGEAIKASTAGDHIVDVRHRHHTAARRWPLVPNCRSARELSCVNVLSLRVTASERAGVARCERAERESDRSERVAERSGAEARSLQLGDLGAVGPRQAGRENCGPPREKVVSVVDEHLVYPWHQQQLRLFVRRQLRRLASLTLAPRCPSSTCPRATCQSRTLIMLSSRALARGIE